MKLMKAQEATAISKTRDDMVAEIKEILRTVAGVRTNELAYQLASQIANLQLWNKADGTAGNYMTAVNLLVEIKPETATEAMLAVQMIGVHHLATMSLARANGEGQSFEPRLRCSSQTSGSGGEVVPGAGLFG